jgi:hypothetical protein
MSQVSITNRLVINNPHQDKDSDYVAIWNPETKEVGYLSKAALYSDASPQYNKITSQFGFSLLGNVLNINPNWTWVIKKLNYSNISNVIFDIPFTSEDGMNRTDLIVANNLDSFTRIEGDESLTDAVEPAFLQPGLIATKIHVTHDTIEVAPPPDLTGYYTKTEVDEKTLYTNPTPTIAAIGGIPIGSTFSSETMQDMWDKLLYPELFPALVNPSNTFAISSTGIFETGFTIPTINLNASFNRGSINPAYGTNGFRSGLPSNYIYTGPIVSSNASTALSDTEVITNYVVANGVNTWAGSVSYSEGEQPLSSSGEDFSTALPAGTTGIISASLTGTYPVFYGKSASLPVANQALINGGTKIVAVSTGTVNIVFNASIEYLWFAIPEASTDKTKWFVDALNKGDIGSPTDLFKNDVIVNVNSPTALWNGINYRIYISNYATTTAGNMQLQN